jgi:hypothetical protein
MGVRRFIRRTGELQFLLLVWRTLSVVDAVIDTSWWKSIW